MSDPAAARKALQKQARKAKADRRWMADINEASERGLSLGAELRFVTRDGTEVFGTVVDHHRHSYTGALCLEVRDESQTVTRFLCLREAQDG